MRIGVRWTVGDVSSRGFEALKLSILGAHAVFGPEAGYVVGVNTIDVPTAKAAVGSAARFVDWYDANDRIPHWLRSHLGIGMAEGVAWKFSPVHLFPDRHCLALDNDVILWRMPPSVRAWLQEADSALIAEDVKGCYGQFADLCPATSRNSGIRGLPPGYDLEERLRRLLAQTQITLSSETDEQGLQVAVLSREKHHVVGLDEVAICGYFRPHLLELGSCGAHFVGVNARQLPWSWNGRRGHEYVQEYWDWRKTEVIDRLLKAGAAIGSQMRRAVQIEG
jgi:hypothetical protein